ncbi:MAG: right-handed parallel beta-helix repeat-containing protein [Methanotrichaceae archaeon]|nr:right-handed parallel beta-helix repeat-containing protein [Methanotrichaceae archaeon]
MKGMPEKPLRLLVAIFAFILLVNCANAVVSVKPGERIQAAIDAAPLGEIIEISSGIYQECLVVDRSLVLKGISSEGAFPRVESENGPAITIKANGVILEGLGARSASGWTGDAGILVLSNDNIIRNNMASGSGNAGILLQMCSNNTLYGNVVQGNGKEGILLKNASRNRLENNEVSDNRYGCKLVASQENRILGNTLFQNRFEAINLQESHANLIEGNFAASSDGALVMDRSRDNIVRKNDFVGNEKGIYLSYLGTGKEVQSKGKGVVISYNSMSSSELVSSNNSIYENNLSNKNNARDDSFNNWDNGKVGNNYSDFNDPAEGCKGIKICDAQLSVSGGPSVDRYPQASPVSIPGRSTGYGGVALQLSGKSYLPGSKLFLNFTAPAGREVWVRMADAGEKDLQDDLYLGQNISGDVVLAAPQKEGSYLLLMHDENGAKVLSLPFNVTVPGLSATPATVYTCEKINVAFWGAFGQEDDWIGMYREGSSDVMARQMLGSRESGNAVFSAPDEGSYSFKMFAGGAALPLASSSAVGVKENAGHKVIAEPSQVAPGGTVTVTFWGAAPASVIGMYGMTRPDKFDLGKRSTGRQSCGSMVWRLPKAPGQYDFRLFQDDINRPLLAQSNVVTVS